jgi:hypothetical protein
MMQKAKVIAGHALRLLHAGRIRILKGIGIPILWYRVVVRTGDSRAELNRSDQPAAFRASANCHPLRRSRDDRCELVSRRVREPASTHPFRSPLAISFGGLLNRLLLLGHNRRFRRLRHGGGSGDGQQQCQRECAKHHPSSRGQITAMLPSGMPDGQEPPSATLSIIRERSLPGSVGTPAGSGTAGQTTRKSALVRARPVPRSANWVAPPAVFPFVSKNSAPVAEL